MLTVYHSNQLKLFMKFVINIISNHELDNPMQSEIILTEHKMMTQWIEIELTSYFGIAANIKFMNIQSFIRKIAIELLSDNLIINNFDHDFMYWNFMEILPKLRLNKKCFIIQKYLNFDIDQKKCSQLACQLSKLFLEYLTYRLDWLHVWKFNKIVDDLDIEQQMWQSEIWRVLLNHIQYKLEEFNPVSRCIFFLQSKNEKINWNKLPNRIFIYGVTSIPPTYWKILNLLSYHINIYLWFINPCMNDWDNIININALKNMHQKQYQLYDDESDILSEFNNNNIYNRGIV